MADSREPRRPGAATLGIHGGARERKAGDPVVPPIVQSATFVWGQPSDGELLYSRYGNNPNQEALGRKIASLEGTDAGAALASGMGATAMTLLALTELGDHVVASSYLYGATYSLLRDELPRRGVATTFVDPESGGWEEAFRPETRVVMLETPTNPTLRIVDPRPIVALAHARGIKVVMDATFASPVNLRAADLGVDVVIHSATKYLGGHSDLIAGVVAGSAEVIHEIVRVSRLYGPALDAHAAWLLDRGIRSLDVRVRRHNENAAALAQWFETRSEVARVLYPGLQSHPDHALAKELLGGFGGMLSIVVNGGGDGADRFMKALELAMVAPSLGGVETLVSQPRYTSHASLTREERTAQGIAEGFVRISVGLEDFADLRDDFERGLKAVG
ncbi:MAG TPA: aminotransferase class I/II-fold pyridoxal phosphate-dependent enzyme [Longimicrobiales bacterium]|nr:aminotransferase class I/II-fold pyridoxal phosphate-dependent enzyme [Longimicrobiales bacterium]